MPLTRLVERGALPISVDSNRGYVVLRELAGARFDEPGFDGTVRASYDPLYRCSIAEFVHQATEFRPVQPLRLIAHTARCGSTLLANLLALRPQHMVLKEPAFLIHAAQRALRAEPDAAALTTALLSYCRAVADARNRSLVVKLTSWTAPLIHRTLDAQARWLFQWREPAEVVASLLATPPQWWTNKQVRLDASRLLSGDSATLAHFYAQMWCAITAPFTNSALPVRALEYTDMAEDKLQALLAAEEWLALGTGQAAPEGFTEKQSQYSKADRPQCFDPARTHRRPELADEDATTVRLLSAELVSILRDSTATGRLL